MKKRLSFLSMAAIALISLSSCCTINYSASLANDGAIGQKVGEAKSMIYLGFIGSGGKNATIKDAAANGNIKKVKQVEYSDKSMLLGLIVEHTTRVYGE